MAEIIDGALSYYFRGKWVPYVFVFACGMAFDGLLVEKKPDFAGSAYFVPIALFGLSWVLLVLSNRRAD